MKVLIQIRMDLFMTHAESWSVTPTPAYDRKAPTKNCT